MPSPFLIAEDEALKEYLKGMTVTDEKSSVTPNVKTRAVTVRFGYPDVEIGKQDFPFVTIELIDITPANYRQVSGKYQDIDYRGSIAPSANLSYEYDIPVAYDISYQITTYARHPRHDRAILFQMWNKFPSKYGKLKVKNPLGTETVLRTMTVEGYAKRDTFEDAESGNRRLLRNVFTVNVVSEMTPAIAAQASRVTEEVIINIPQNNPFIPSVYEIL